MNPDAIPPPNPIHGMDPGRWAKVVMEAASLAKLDLKVWQIDRVMQPAMAGPGEPPPLAGYIVMACTTTEYPRVGLRWGWIEIQPDALAVVDLTAVRTNILLHDAPYTPAPASALTLQLARIVHGLPWQTLVLREIQRHDLRHKPPRFLRKRSPAEPSGGGSTGET